MKKVFGFIFTLILAFNVNAQDISVDITSDDLEVDRVAGTAIFSGNVKALYRDMTLTSEILEIYYDEKSQGDKIKTIIAKTDVVVIQGTDKVNADYAEYYPNKNNIIFKENVILNRAGNILEGDHLVMDTITNKAKMSSTGEKRVKAVYFKDAEKAQTTESTSNE